MLQWRNHIIHQVHLYTDPLHISPIKRYRKEIKRCGINSEKFIKRLISVKPIIVQLSLTWRDKKDYRHPIYIIVDNQAWKDLSMNEALINDTILPCLKYSWNYFFDVDIELKGILDMESYIEFFPASERIAEARILFKENYGISVIYPFSTLIPVEKYLEKYNDLIL